MDRIPEYVIVERFTYCFAAPCGAATTMVIATALSVVVSQVCEYAAPTFEIAVAGGCLHFCAGADNSLWLTNSRRIYRDSYMGPYSGVIAKPNIFT